MLKDKIGWNRKKNPILLDPWGTVELKYERADSEAKQSIKVARDSQLLLTVADLKAQGK
jgi:hypothetical protein